tara:strand:+ start:2650 stop:2838 length:189 start_codon:yes stop_codon:yes gene_type:complete
MTDDGWYSRVDTGGEGNGDGLWCDVCGNLIAPPWWDDWQEIEPEYCDQCGAPDEEEIAEFFQ